MKIAYITTCWANSQIREEGKDYGGVGYYRAYKPAQYLREIGHKVDIFSSNFQEQIDKKNPAKSYVDFARSYDIVIAKQLDNRMAAQMLIGACKETKTPIIMDIDDNFLAVERWQPAWDKGYNPTGVKRAYAVAALSMCDGVFVSTEPLKEVFTKLFKTVFNEEKPIFVLPNMNDKNDWQFESQKPKNIVIGWHGSITHDEDLAYVFEPIQRIMKKYPEVTFEIMGGIRKDVVKKVFKDWDRKLLDRVRMIGGTPTWYGFPERLMQQKWSIGIAPLLDIPFNHSKSHIKWLEYSIKGIPTIASDITPYSDYIEHGKTGLLAKTKDDWFNGLDNLIKDEKLRDFLSKNAKEKVIKDIQYKDNIKLWETAIKSFLKKPRGRRKS